MITLSSIINAAETAIRADTAISTFCTANYSKTLKIFKGESKNARPTEDDAPYVILGPPMDDYDVGAAAEARMPGLEVDFAVFKDSRYGGDDTTKDVGITRTSSDNTIKFDGLYECDSLGMLILTALQTAFTDAKSEDHVHVADYSLSGVGPLWEGGISVKLRYEQGMGEAAL